MQVGERFLLPLAQDLFAGSSAAVSVRAYVQSIGHFPR